MSKSTPARITAAASILAFILAGRARVTLVSAKTGARFTYRIRPAKGTEGPFFVSVLTGPDNGADFTFLGTIFPDAFRHGTKSTIGRDAPSARAWAWAWPFLAKGEIPVGLEVWHEGKCGCCGRALTVPESIATGIGPTCAQKGAA